MFQHRDYAGGTFDKITQYVRHYTCARMNDESYNDKASSLKVISNIPSNDSVLVNEPEVLRTLDGVVPMPESSPGATMYQTNDLRVVFIGYQHRDYGGERIYIVPDNGRTKKHARLDNIGWNDKMSSCTLRLAVRYMYSDSPQGAYTQE